MEDPIGDPWFAALTLRSIDEVNVYPDVYVYNINLYVSGEREGEVYIKFSKIDDSLQSYDELAYLNTDSSIFRISEDRFISVVHSKNEGSVAVLGELGKLYIDKADLKNGDYEIRKPKDWNIVPLLEVYDHDNIDREHFFGQMVKRFSTQPRLQRFLEYIRVGSPSLQYVEPDPSEAVTELPAPDDDEDNSETEIKTKESPLPALHKYTTINAEEDPVGASWMGALTLRTIDEVNVYPNVCVFNRKLYTFGEDKEVYVKFSQIDGRIRSFDELTYLDNHSCIFRISDDRYIVILKSKIKGSLAVLGELGKRYIEKNNFRQYYIPIKYAEDWKIVPIGDIYDHNDIDLYEFTTYAKNRQGRGSWTYLEDIRTGTAEATLRPRPTTDSTQLPPLSERKEESETTTEVISEKKEVLTAEQSAQTT